MAKSYSDINNSVYTVGNSMGWTNSLLRSNGIPVDITDIYDSYESAVTYAASNPVAYEGQVITVTENGDSIAYVITPAKQGTITIGGSITDVYLKEIGSATSGDGKSIVLNEDKTLSLKGFGKEYYAYNNETKSYDSTVTSGWIDGLQPRLRKISDSEYELAWYQPNPLTFEAITNVISGLDGRVNSVESDVSTLKSDTSTLKTDVSDLKTTVGNDASGLVKDVTDLKTTVGDSDSGLVKAVAANTSAITQNTSDIATKANIEDVYTKTAADAKIAEAVAAADHLKRTIVSSISDINLEAADADQYIYMVPKTTAEDNDSYDEYMVLNGALEKVGDWKVDLSEYAKTADVTTELNKKLNISDQYITSVDTDLSVTDKKLSITEIAQSKVTGLADALNSKADEADVLTKDNTTEYTPSTDYNPATKKYVDDKDERIKYYDDPDITPSPESYFTVNSTGETITGLTDTGKTQTELVIPYKINGVEITTLYSGIADGPLHSILNGSTTITKVVLPNSVSRIKGNAFERCTSLTSINIPNRVTSIGEYAFSGCSGLTSINIPNSVTSIEQGAFDGCRGLTSINIPNSVTSIGDYAFSATALKSITIPNSVTSIGICAFYSCRGLTSINIPNSVTSIGRGAFSGCTALKSINIPNSVTNIGSETFDGCTSLTSITIPNSVTSIDDTSFNGCTNLTIYCEQGSYAETYANTNNIPVKYTDIDPSKYLTKDNTTEYTPSADYNPATKKYVDDGLSAKADKEDGKGFSTNDYTNADKAKVDLLAVDSEDASIIKIPGALKVAAFSSVVDATTGETLQSQLDARNNKIESIKVNNVALDITDKTVNIPIGTTTDLGVVKSSSDADKVTINADGTMTVNSYNAIKIYVDDVDTLVVGE